jgi:RNA polymerase sigma-70 factor (ECF subfamily)
VIEQQALAQGPSIRAERLRADALEFANLYDTHADFVWRNARRLGVRSESLDDVVQEVFLVVHRRMPELAQHDSMRAWLFGILVRVVQNYRRHVKRKDPRARSNEPVVDPTLVPDSDGTDPHVQAERDDAVRLIQRVLQDMDLEKREVFILVELEEMNVAEVAEGLQVNAHTIQSRVRAARKQFESILVQHKARDEWRLR